MSPRKETDCACNTICFASMWPHAHVPYSMSGDGRVQKWPSGSVAFTFFSKGGRRTSKVARQRASSSHRSDWDMVINVVPCCMRLPAPERLDLGIDPASSLNTAREDYSNKRIHNGTVAQCNFEQRQATRGSLAWRCHGCSVWPGRIVGPLGRRPVQTAADHPIHQPPHF